MSNARAQFKLPSSIRNVHGIGDFYYFGPYLAARDMMPISFDRVVPSEVASSTSSYSPLSLSGTGVNVGASHTGFQFSSSSAQALFSDNGMVGVFKSTSGVTLGRSFTITHGGCISEVKSNKELEYRSKLPYYSILDNYLDFATILAENIDYFFVVAQSRYSETNDQESAQKVSIFRVSKTGFTVARMTEDNAYNYSSPTPGDANFNKTIRYLGVMDDGKHLFTSCRTRRYGTHGDFMFYMLLDTSSTEGSVDYSTAVTRSESSVGYSYGLPSNLLRRDNDVLGHWYFPQQLADDDVKIVRRAVDGIFVGRPPLIPAAGTEQHSYCTLSGMPEGVVLPTPGTDISDTANIGQISTWLVKDGDKDYLIYYAHNGGENKDEDNAITPVDRHVMFVFEIDGQNSNNLIYRNHLTNGFGYSHQLPGICLNADRKTAIVCNGKGFGILSWSSDAQSYVVSPWRGVSGVNRVTFDTSSQIWVEDTAGSVYVFNPDLSSSVVVTFGNNISSILYSGQPLSVVAKINVYSFVGDRVSRNVRLYANGCTFDDGTASRDITTLSDADTEINVVINGQGSVTLDAFLI